MKKRYSDRESKTVTCWCWQGANVRHSVCMLYELYYKLYRTVCTNMNTNSFPMLKPPIHLLRTSWWKCDRNFADQIPYDPHFFTIPKGKQTVKSASTTVMSNIRICEQCIKDSSIKRLMKEVELTNIRFQWLSVWKFLHFKLYFPPISFHLHLFASVTWIEINKSKFIPHPDIL